MSEITIRIPNRLTNRTGTSGLLKHESVPDLVNTDSNQILSLDFFEIGDRLTALGPVMTEEQVMEEVREYRISKKAK